MARMGPKPESVWPKSVATGCFNGTSTQQCADVPDDAAWKPVGNKVTLERAWHMPKHPDA